MADVAILGIGRMGTAIARRVIGAGHALTVWNRTPRPADELAASVPGGSITVAETAAEAVRDRDIILSVLADGSATRTVLLDSAVLAALRPGSVVCDLATSGPAAARELDAVLTTAGIQFVDAPVSGSVPAVDAGTLLVMAAGPERAIGAAKPVLDAFARAVVRVGAAGSGQVMKLVVNLVVHDLNAALSEALLMAEKAGITRESAYDVLQQSVIAAPFVTYKRAAFLDPSPSVAMSLHLVDKDLQLILDLATSIGVQAPVTEAARRAVSAACAAGLGPSDMAVLSRFTGEAAPPAPDPAA